MNNKDDLVKRVAWLESKLDQVEAELSHLNNLLLECGFPEGVQSLKITIEELLHEINNPHLFPSDEKMPKTFDLF